MKQARRRLVRLEAPAPDTVVHVRSATAIAAESLRTGLPPATSSPRATPDQNRIDDMGRAYGLAEEDTHELHSSFEMLSRRDRHRAELIPPRRPQP